MFTPSLLLSVLVLSLPQLTRASEEPPRYPCLPPTHNTYPFCNTSLPLPARARSLVSMLSLPEKALLLSSTAPSVPRLGLPPYEWWSESLHGLAANGPGVSFSAPIPSSTSFPQVLVQSSSFNRSLWSLVAGTIAAEARAMYNAGHAGLTFWAPNINIFRDPRWGRGQETPGEDPLVASEFAVRYSKAFQGEYRGDSRWQEEEGRRVLEVDDDDGRGDDAVGATRLMLSACCKHYVAYDLEKWMNFTRYTFDAEVTKQDMEDTYDPPFRSCVREGRASCVMCSYNAINGVPVCASEELMRKFRDDWGFQGYITSDCNAVATIFEYQKYAPTAVDAVIDALKAGVDLNCGGYYALYAQQAVQSGNLTESDIDRALFNLFSVQLRLGLFDGDPTVNSPFQKLGPGDVCTGENQQLALEAARQGIVLLKNENQLLPFSATDVHHIAVIGPGGNDASKLNGDYTGIPCEEKTIFDALQERVEQVSFASGCADGIPCNSRDGFNEAMGIAKLADVAVVVAGLDLSQETEDLDRVSLLLPGRQGELVTAVASIAKRPIVLVLLGCGPMDVTFAKEDPRIGSIIWAGYPGEAGGKAIADTILGVFNPGGLLPVTWYPESFTTVPMNDMNMRANESRGYPGRTYRFYTGPAIYEFGYGLSYTKYSLSILPTREVIDLSAVAVQCPLLSNAIKDGHVLVNGIDGACCEAMKFRVKVVVKNEGHMDGSYAMLLFSRAEVGLTGAPLKQLIGFDRVLVAAGTAEEASIAVDPCSHMSMADASGKMVLPLGRHFLMLGNDVEHSLNIIS